METFDWITPTMSLIGVIIGALLAIIPVSINNIRDKRKILAEKYSDIYKPFIARTKQNISHRENQHELLQRTSQFISELIALTSSDNIKYYSDIKIFPYITDPFDNSYFFTLNTKFTAAINNIKVYINLYCIAQEKSSEESLLLKLLNRIHDESMKASAICYIQQSRYLGAAAKEQVILIKRLINMYDLYDDILNKRKISKTFLTISNESDFIENDDTVDRLWDEASAIESIPMAEKEKMCSQSLKEVEEAVALLYERKKRSVFHSNTLFHIARVNIEEIVKTRKLIDSLQLDPETQYLAYEKLEELNKQLTEQINNFSTYL